MKKLFTSAFILIAAIALLNGQGIIISDVLKIADFEGDAATRTHSMSAYTGEDGTVSPNLKVVGNPAKDDLNGSDSVFVFARIDDGNSYSHQSTVTITFNSLITVTTQNFIRMKCYSPDRNTGFRYTYLKEGEVVVDNWAQAISNCNGAWAYVAFSLAGITEFDAIRITVSDAWGATATPGVAYFDDIEMYNESYQYQEAFNGMVYNAQKTNEVMEIDGLDLEDIWITADYQQITKIAAGDGTGIGAEWAAAWDAEYLYIFLNVTDDNIWKYSDANWAFWKGDGFQVYVDVMERRIDARVFGNLAGFGVCPDLESEGAVAAGQAFTNMLPFGDDYKPLAKQSSIMSGTGYTIELAYPWKGLAFGAGDAITDVDAWVAENVKLGLEIAFDLQLNDDDGAGRVNMISWASEPKEPYGNSGTWGGLKLEVGTGVSSDISSKSLKVYPSVTNDYINIQMNNLQSIEIFDVTGKSVASKIINSNNTRFDVSSLLNGIYIIKASDGKQNAIEKFIKK